MGQRYLLSLWRGQVLEESVMEDKENMDWIDIVLGVVVVIIVGLAAWRIVDKRKKGETGCGYSCNGCPSASACGGCSSVCAPKREEKKEKTQKGDTHV